MSVFDSDEEEDEREIIRRYKKQKVRLGRGGEEKRNILFPKSEPESHAFIALYKSLRSLFRGEVIDKARGDSEYISVYCGDPDAPVIVLLVDNLAPNEKPPVLVSKRNWEECASLDQIPTRFADSVTEIKIDGKPASCAYIIAQLLKHGPSIAVKLTCFLPVEKPKGREYMSMSDADWEAFRVKHFIGAIFAGYMWKEPRIMDMLVPLVSFQPGDKNQRGQYWHITITYDKWIENWVPELWGFVPLFYEK